MKHELLTYQAGSVLFESSSRMEKRGSSITALIAPAVAIIPASPSSIESNYEFSCPSSADITLDLLKMMHFV